MSTLGPQLGDDRGRLGSDLEDYDFEIITKESEARRTKTYVFRCENEEDLRRCLTIPALDLRSAVLCPP